MERVLLVENDPEIIDLAARQALPSIGLRVEVARTAAGGLQTAARFNPDAILLGLKLPDLSGKDLLVALSSQGIETPVIVIAPAGSESEVIQTFRLGAADYLRWPAREAEIVSAVERVLKQVRTRRERETLARKLKQSNDALQCRVRELTTLSALGRAITSLSNPASLYEKIVEAAVYMSEANCGWLLLRENRSSPFILSAQRNLPSRAAAQIGKSWDDGISSLVAVSGEALTIHGEPLKRFAVSRFGKAVLIVPLKVKKEVIGLLVVLRKEEQPFSSSSKALLEAVADYASISLVNTRLVSVLKERARTLHEAAEKARSSERQKEELIRRIQKELKSPLADAVKALDSLLEEDEPRLNAAQKGILRTAGEKLLQVAEIIAAIDNPGQVS